MKKVNRIIRYIRLHLLRNPAYLVSYCFYFLSSKFVPRISYYSDKEMVEQIKAGKSIIRLGDGEIYIMNFGAIGYQQYDPKLRMLFFQLIKNYSIHSNYVVSLPRLMIEKTNLQLRKEKLLNCWLPFKVMYQLHFPKKISYGDAFWFYYNETIPNLLEEYLLTKHIIYVTNQVNAIAIQQNSLIPFKESSFVITPTTDTFAEYEKIKEKIIYEVEKNAQNECIVLAACGPTSKVLAYELAQRGIVTIDVGRGIEIAYTANTLEHFLT